jgi:fatty-acid desaturase
MYYALIFLTVIVYFASGISASLIYHQVLTHKAITLQNWFEKTMVLIAIPVGTPVQWVGTHRQHHKFTDIEGDPHSPILYGFWYAHTGWYIPTKNKLCCFIYAIAGPLRMIFDGYWRPRNRLEYNHLAADISNKRFYAFLSRPLNYMMLMWIYATLLGIIFYILGRCWGLFALWVILIIVYNLGDSINSIGHLYGKSINDKLFAKNNKFLSKFTFGEGNHAEHHTNPQNPILGKKLTLTKIILFFWIKLGLVKSINKAL